MRRIAAVLLLLAVTACGGARTPQPPVTRAEWHAVLRDWSDDRRFEGEYSCGAVVLAIGHLPASFPVYTTVGADLRREARHVCPQRGHYDAIEPAMSDADVAAIAGVPGHVLARCWLYPVTRERTGRQVCFTRGLVTTLQISVHG